MWFFMLLAACDGSGTDVAQEFDWGGGVVFGTDDVVSTRDVVVDVPPLSPDGEDESLDLLTPFGDVGDEIRCTMVSQCTPYGLICDYELGVCRAPICEALTARCADPVTVERCTPDGLRWISETCSGEDACEAGACLPVVCTPGEVQCVDGLPTTCNDSGTQRAAELCPSNGRCVDGACRPVLHNIVVLFDTSGSMNSCASGVLDEATGCCGEVCPEAWPVCETYDAPHTKIGFSKKVFYDLFSDERLLSLTRFALLSFPQTGDDGASCATGYYDNQSTMTGHSSSHAAPAPPGGWFDTNRAEVVRVPFPTTWDEDNEESLRSWVDFTEEENVDPELRAMGDTPLGKSMFYAGEYLRHYVIVQGKPCATDADCGSPDYLCVDGSCTDPIDYCRVNSLIVFTDGNETEDESLQSFFNPIVQARRFQYGLGCVDHDDCLGDALCSGNVCTHANMELPNGIGICTGSGELCEIGDFLPCGPFGGTCGTSGWRFSDSGGFNVLRGYDNEPIQVTIYVINVQGESEESLMIAQNGGGEHYAVDVSNSDLLFEIFEGVIDFKLGTICVPRDEE